MKYKTSAMMALLMGMTLGSSISQSYAAPLHQISIKGNQRVENETILSYVRLLPGSDVSDDDVNQALKTLFATGFFQDVNVHLAGGTLHITVAENPIINRIAYEGNSKLRDDQIKEVIKLRPREVLSRAKVQAAQQTLLEMYRAMGRFSTTVEPKIIQLDDNRCDVVFEIHEAQTTYIRKINLLGNKRFSNSKLKEQLKSKEYRWFRFFANDDTFEPNRFQEDQNVLRQYYLDHGYPDYEQLAALSEITPDYESYHLTFKMKEGAPYTFGTIGISSRIAAVKANDFKEYIQVSKGDTFSDRALEKTIEKITDALGLKGFPFTEVHAVQNKNPQTHTVDITFEIREGPRVYIERVNIHGNSRTRDHVIRREIMLHEGDALNHSRMKQSERRLKDLGYFKEVSVTLEQGSTPDRAVLDVRLEEQSTGELSFSAGFATTDGPLGTIRFIERNFMGKGQTVHADLSVAKRHQDINIGFMEPRLFGKELEGSIDAFAARSTRFCSYTHLSKGISPSVAYRLTEHLSQSLHYLIKQDRVTHISQYASNYLREQAGSYITSEIGQTLYYDRRDSRIDPTSGYVLTLANAYAGLGGKVKYLKHIVGGTVYFTPIEDILLALKGSYGVMQKAGKKIRIVDSFFLGADSFRGFEYGGLGPRDIRTGDALGGTRFWMTTAETLFPIGLPNEFGVKGALYSDIGTVWKSTESGPNVRDNHKVRASWGVGLVWRSPFGPIRIDYSTPYKKDKFDETQRFLIGFKSQI